MNFRTIPFPHAPQFVADIEKIKKNALLYNGATSWVVEDADCLWVESSRNTWMESLRAEPGKVEALVGRSALSIRRLVFRMPTRYVLLMYCSDGICREGVAVYADL